MKKLIMMSLVCILTTEVWGTTLYIVDFNENGKGCYFYKDNQTTPLTPYGGSTQPLFYVLPIDVTAGDVLIYEDTQRTKLSDVLRFGPFSTGMTKLTVYSDVEQNESHPDLADTGLPDIFSINQYRAVEDSIGEDRWDGYDYWPPASDYPGGIKDDMIIYNFTSDIPEPASAMIMIFGGLVIALKRRKRLGSQ